MAKQVIGTIIENRCVARDVYSMVLEADTSDIDWPGQFVNVQIAGFFLRRPISICTYTEHTLTLIYKVVGQGTAKMATMVPGDKFNLLVGLGNGFDKSLAKGKNIALIGGGVGLPPLYGLAKAFLPESVTCIMGFGSVADVFYADEFAALGATVYITTMDGTLGQKGVVTDVLSTLAVDYYFTCGPEPMLRAVHASGIEGQLSFEARMGCGFGACMGCSCQTIAGPKRICVDGPVMLSSEVIFA